MLPIITNNTFNDSVYISLFHHTKQLSLYFYFHLLMIDYILGRFSLDQKCPRNRPEIGEEPAPWKLMVPVEIFCAGKQALPKPLSF